MDDVRENVSIIVCCHKDDYYYSGPGFIPVQVGKAIAKTDLDIQGDDEGDNISAKNPNYCELTAHYWLWKNNRASKYVGLNHYRRYFDFNHKLPFGLFFRNVSKKEIEKNPPTLPDLDRLFEKYDIVLSKPNIYPYSLFQDYCMAHIFDDFQILEMTVKKMYPDYMDSFSHIMRKNNRLSHYNMFIMQRDRFNDYSEWLFNILFEVEKYVKISAYPFQARVFGYMSERLLNVYVYHHRFRVKYVPVMKVCEDIDGSVLRCTISAFRNKITAWMLSGYANS